MSILKITEPARTREISVKSLKEAICLKCANCYRAMSFANALGGCGPPGCATSATLVVGHT